MSRLNLKQLPAAYQAQARAQLDAAVPIRRKYRNVPVTADGERYDSKLEYRCAQWLELRKMAGEVAWVLRQPSFRLEGGVRYRADFLAVLTSGGVEVIDAKGKLTPECKNKLKQLTARYGVEVKLWPG